MTAPELLRGEVGRLAPLLLSEHSVLVLVPAGNPGWAAAAAWDLARSLAASRRVVLVDASVDSPALDGGATVTAAEGIVDIFEFGVSWNHVGRQQDIPTLHYVGVGTLSADGPAIWSSTRWARLQRGFEREGALLLLYLPVEALAGLTFIPDGIVLLCAHGMPESRAYSETLESSGHRGLPVVAVVRDEHPDKAEETADAAELTDSPAWVRAKKELPTRRKARPFRRKPVAAGVVAVVLVVVGVLVLWRNHGVDHLLVVNEPVTQEEQTAAAPVVAAPMEVVAPPVAYERDSLYYTVQVAAFSSLAQAMEMAEQLGGRGWLTTVTPVYLGRRGMWHRVVTGAFPTARSADSALRTLRRERVVAGDQGMVLRTPHAILLGTYRGGTEAEGEAQGLRSRRIPAYILAGRDGGTSLLIGAFETPEQARAADSLLVAAGLNGPLVSRTGLQR